jgi:CMP-N,N'-diacetyllegionaminic acid synthase
MIQEKSVLAIIPARGGSKGLPGKNLAPLGGKPLIAWTIEAALQSQYIDRLILSSDDTTIIHIAAQYGCDAPFIRPAELARDDSSTLDTVLHALQQLPGYDITVLLQPTSPLRDSRDIDNTLATLFAENAGSCVSVTAPDKSPYWMYTTDQHGSLRPLLDPNLSGRQRQELPPVYVLNGAVYAIYTDLLLNTREFVPDGTVPYLMSKEHSVDVDYQLDLDFVELLLRKNQSAQSVNPEVS